MFGSKKKLKQTKVDSLIGHNTELFGDIRFSGGLHIDGTVRGNVLADEDGHSVLTLSADGTIEGEVRVPNVWLDGAVIGDVHAKHHIELAPNARIQGDVYYTLIEMAMGAEVNGSLVHKVEEDVEPKLRLNQPTTLEIVEES